MLGKFLSVVFCLLIATVVQAETVIGVEWLELDTDSSIEGSVSSLGILDLTVGYRFDLGAALNWTVEFHYGIGGLDSINIGGLDTDVSEYYGLNLRGQWQLGNNFYLYVAPSYTKIELESERKSIFGCGPEPNPCFTLHEGDWEVGAAIGLGYSFSNSISAELSARKLGDADILGISLRYHF